MKKLILLAMLFFTYLPYSSAQEVTGPYVKAFAGIQLVDGYEFEGNNANNFLTADIKFNNGYQAGAAIGYRFSENFALELESTARNNKIDSLQVVNAKALGSGDFSSTAIMLNAFYYFTNFEYVNPYVGFGMGFLNDSKLEVNIENFGSNYKADGEAFAFQTMVGLEVPVNQQFRFFFEGRIFSASSPDVTANNNVFNTEYDSYGALGGVLYIF